MLSGAAFAGTDIIHGSYMNSYSQVFTFNLPDSVDSYDVKTRVAGSRRKRPDCPTHKLLKEDKRLEVEINKEGVYVISVFYKGTEMLSGGVFRKMNTIK